MAGEVETLVVTIKTSNSEEVSLTSDVHDLLPDEIVSIGEHMTKELLAERGLMDFNNTAKEGKL